MVWEIVNVVGLVAIGYYMWEQHQRIENAETMIKYILELLDDEDEDDVLSDY